MRKVLAGDLALPSIGQGTWHIGENKETSQDEIDAIKCGIDLGLNLIDTAEMYGDGRSETLIGNALKKIRREDVFLVSKVYPHNAGKPEIFKSCDASLKRLNTNYLDIYLLHWRGSVPLAETVDCMEQLVQNGKIRRWGVSNFDVDDMEELLRIPNGNNCAANQVLYHLGSRGIEYDLLPWLEDHGIAAMAYCPMAQAGRLQKTLLEDPTLSNISKKYDISVYQLLLAFTIRNPNIISIPKASSVEHVRKNAAVSELVISQEDWEKVDKSFLSPSSKLPLDVE